MSNIIQSCLICRRSGTRWLPTVPPTCPQCHSEINFAGNQETLGEFTYKYRKEVLLEQLKKLDAQAKLFIKQLDDEEKVKGDKPESVPKPKRNRYGVLEEDCGCNKNKGDS